MSNSFGKMGIVLYGVHLVYAFDHGYFRWAPMFFKWNLVKVWNFVACRIFRHVFVEDFDGVLYGDVCVHCSSKKKETR